MLLFFFNDDSKFEKYLLEIFQQVYILLILKSNRIINLIFL